MPSKFLAIHLNDHLAAATATLEVARRIAGQYEETELGRFAAGLVPRLEEDRTSIEALMSRFGVRHDPAKQAVAWVGEKAGRLKLNGRVFSSSPLSPLVEVEGLSLGIAATGMLWRNLAAVAGELGLDPAPLEAAIARADDDREQLELLRHDVARRALTAG